MKLFKKKETINESIAFMALMSAINVIFTLLTIFIPFLLFVLVFILPLSAALVVLLTNKRSFIIYAVATLGLCLIISMNNITDALFYILPSLITGFIFAVCIEKSLPTPTNILLATAVQFCISYLSIPLIKLITQVDMIDVIYKIFKIDSGYSYNALPITLIFLVSFFQEVVSFLVIRYGLDRIKLNFKKPRNPVFLNIIGICFTLLASILVCIFFQDIIYVCLGLFLIYFAYLLISFLKDTTTWFKFFLAIYFFVCFYVFVMLIKLLSYPWQMIMIEIELSSIIVILIINNCLLKRDKTIK